MRIGRGGEQEGRKDRAPGRRRQGADRTRRNREEKEGKPRQVRENGADEASAWGSKEQEWTQTPAPSRLPPDREGIHCR